MFRIVALCSHKSLPVFRNSTKHIEKTNNGKYANGLIIYRLFITNIRDLITSDDHIICTIVFFDSQLIKKELPFVVTY